MSALPLMFYSFAALKSIRCIKAFFALLHHEIDSLHIFRCGYTSHFTHWQMHAVAHLIDDF